MRKQPLVLTMAKANSHQEMKSANNLNELESEFLPIASRRSTDLVLPQDTPPMTLKGEGSYPVPRPLPLPEIEMQNWELITGCSFKL